MPISPTPSATESGHSSQHYRPSERPYPERISAWEYPEGFELRQVKETGFFNYGGRGYFLSEAFGGKEIAVRPPHIHGCISLFFRQFRIGRIDVDKPVFTFRRTYLIAGDLRTV